MSSLLSHDIVWNVLSPFATANGTKKPIRQADFGIIQENLANNYDFEFTKSRLFYRQSEYNNILKIV
mgnify:CR=1 FL=1